MILGCDIPVQSGSVVLLTLVGSLRRIGTLIGRAGE